LGRRGVIFLLGQNAKVMDNTGFQQLLRRRTEWAATGKVLAGKNKTAITEKKT